MKTAREQYALLLQNAALALMTALLVARPLIPGEDAAGGSGLLFVLLWLLAAVFWALACAVGRQGVYRANLIDLAVGLLVLAQVASAVFVAAARRPAINMAWEWVALGLVYLLVRQLVAPGKPTRALVTVVVALAFSFSLHGLYQRYWAFPELRLEYERSPEAMLREVGIELGDWEQERFRRRLYSNEPFGTFALANSLAGFLVPWLVVALGALIQLPERAATPSDGSRGNRRRRPWFLNSLLKPSGWLGLVAVAALAACLALTHSRTAYVGVLAGGVLLAVAARGGPTGDSSVNRRRRWWVFGLCAVGLMVLLVAVARYFERPVVRNASESLAYRLEYWKGAWGVIKAHPLLGVGPANFRQHYVQYKLPQASEEVLDPHNLILDVWATGGCLAVLGLMAGLGLFVLQMMRGKRAEPEEGTSGTAIFVGALAGWLIGFVVGVPVERLVGLSLGWALGLVLVGPLFHRGALNPTWLLAGAVALVVHLCGQGGISIPPVAQNLWMILPLGIIAVGTASAWKIRLGQVTAWTVTVFFIGVTALCATTTYTPVMRCRFEMIAAQDQVLRGNFRSAVEHAKQAAIHDPQSTEPWLWLLQAYRMRWEERPGGDVGPWFSKAVDAAKEIIRLDPNSVGGYRNLGDLHLENARRTKSQASAENAVRAYRKCVELYPSSARRRGDLSDALWLSGQKGEATKRALQALRMEQRTKHPEKFLHPEMRQRLRERIGAENPVSELALPAGSSIASGKHV